jgi:hypothetical protein
VRPEGLAKLEKKILLIWTPSHQIVIELLPSSRRDTNQRIPLITQSQAVEKMECVFTGETTGLSPKQTPFPPVNIYTIVGKH